MKFLKRSKMHFRPSLPVPGPRISMQTFTSLLLITISVSFIVFLFAFDTSNHCLHLLNAARPFALERKNEKKFTWLQKFKLKLKSVGDKGHDGA